MAGERKRVWGELCGVLMAWVALKWTGEQIDPQRLNPYGGERAARSSQRVAEHVRRMNWLALGYRIKNERANASGG